MRHRITTPTAATLVTRACDGSGDDGSHGAPEPSAAAESDNGGAMRKDEPR